VAAPHKPDWDFIYSVARHELDTQLAFLDGLDTKLGIVFSAGSAEAAIVSAAFAVARVHTVWAALVLALSLAGYVAIAWFALWGLRPQKWAHGETIDGVAGDYVHHPPSDVIRRAINAVRLAIKYNQAWYDEKVRDLEFSLLALTVETVAAALALLLIAAAGQGS
jgi:hypothetical protein